MTDWRPMARKALKDYPKAKRRNGEDDQAVIKAVEFALKMQDAYPNAHDADNYAGKFLLDGLTKAGVIVDDDMAHIRLHIGCDYDKANPRTVITIREAVQ